MQTTAELQELLLSGLRSSSSECGERISWGAIQRSANDRHLVCSLTAPKSAHKQLEEFLSKHTATAVKIKESKEDGHTSYRVALDIGQFFYFRQPRLLTEAQLAEAGVRKQDCRVRPGRKAFFVPQFGDRKRRSPEEIGEFLRSLGLTAEQAVLAQRTAARNSVCLDERDVHMALRARLAELNLPQDDFLRYAPEVPDIYLPKRDEAALVGTEQEMLTARRRVKKEMELYKPGSEQYKKLDSQQLALKILCNSLYGATGVKVGKLAGMHISATVTAEGKRSILNTSAEVERKFNGDTQGGDTDSVFVHIPSIPTLDSIYERIEVVDEATGELRRTTRIQEVVDFVNTLVPPPMKTEFEKAYLNYFVPASADDSEEAPKKRAAFVEHMPFWDSLEKSMKFEGKGKIGFKGLETKRRDSCLIAQETIKGFITRLLSVGPDKSEEDATAEAVAFARAQVEKVLNGNVPFHQMIQARQLSKKNYASKLPHVEICEKKRRRGEPVPELGSRIPFVVVTGSKGRKFFESVEDPDYALEHNMQLDYMYIIEKKIQAPLQRFTKNMPNTEALNAAMFGNLRKRHRRNVQDDDPMARFVHTLEPCAQCGEPSAEMVCRVCAPLADWRVLWNNEMVKRQKIEERLDEALKTCRACMAIGEDEEVVCSNMGCAEYFPRRGSQFELARQQAHIDEVQRLGSAHGLDAMQMAW